MRARSELGYHLVLGPPPFILGMSPPWRVYPYINLSTQRKTLHTTERNARRPLMTFGTALQQGWWCGYGAGAVQALDLLTYLLCRSVTTACCYSHLLLLSPALCWFFPSNSDFLLDCPSSVRFLFLDRNFLQSFGGISFFRFGSRLHSRRFYLRVRGGFFLLSFRGRYNNNNKNKNKIIIIISVSFLALHSAVTDWVAILQISQSLSGSTLGGQHWCQQCSFACGCVPSVRQAGRQPHLVIYDIIWSARMISLCSASHTSF